MSSSKWKVCNEDGSKVYGHFRGKTADDAVKHCADKLKQFYAFSNNTDFKVSKPGRKEYYMVRLVG